MDVNGSRFHLLIGERDWKPLLASQPDSGLEWDSHCQGVGLKREVPRFPRNPGETPLGPGQRRGADRDRYGNFYWIDETQKAIRYLPAGTGQDGPFWSVADLNRHCDTLRQDRGVGPCPPPAGDFQPVVETPNLDQLTLRGLAVTTQHYLVVGTWNPFGLLVFDLHAGGPPSWMIWPTDVPFAPFDISRSCDGGVWILDRGPEPNQARYWRLDRFFHVLPISGHWITLEGPSEDLFKPVGGEPRRRGGREFPSGVHLGMASPAEIPYSVAIEALSEDSVLILESDPGLNFSRLHIHQFTTVGRNDLQISLENILAEVLHDPQHPEDVHLKAHDLAWISSLSEDPGIVRGQLYLAAIDGNQAFRFDLKTDADRVEFVLDRAFLPMRRFSGKALVAGEADVFYDFDARWLPLIEQPRRRYAPLGVLKGILVDGQEPEGLVFDGKRPDCVWHRMVLDADIPNTGAITIRSRAANEPQLLAIADWQKEPELILRASGSEQPFHKPFPEFPEGRNRTGIWEALFQSAKGRYLELEITWRGNERSTPRLKALRVHFPRFSYLAQYLPDVFREDQESASFLDRFLANVEGLYTSLEGKIESAEQLLDPRTAPPEFLDWLAGWLGAALDPVWDEARRRLFLAHAHDLYQWRGTLIGLRAAIRLAIEPCPDESLFDEIKAHAVSRPGFVDCSSVLESRSLQRPTCDASESTGMPRYGGRSVRIVEHFLKRRLPGVILGDPTELERPTLVAEGDRWEPAHGAAPLHERFQKFLCRLYGGPKCQKTSELDEAANQPALDRLNAAWNRSPENAFARWSEIRFSPVPPAQPEMARDWQRFRAGPIGFTYLEVSNRDASEYQRYLRRKYRQIDRVNAAYQQTGAAQWNSFGEIPLPGENEFPASGSRLLDWIEFVSRVLPIRRSAHRFTVLVPMELGEESPQRQSRLETVRKVVQREKPAHADFDVKPFWALFQVGGARLGQDTVLGEGSRFVAMVLGAGYLDESYLEESHPWNVPERTLVGRDRLEANHS